MANNRLELEVGGEFATAWDGFLHWYRGIFILEFALIVRMAE
jgi:hypothetical protein